MVKLYQMMVITTITILIVLSLKLDSTIQLEETEIADLGITTARTKCNSNSMGLMMDCNDKLYIQKVKPNEQLKIGQVYIYPHWKDNISVIHRLVACQNENCTKLIFKGDQNSRADPVINRSQITHILKKIEYR